MCGAHSLPPMRRPLPVLLVLLFATAVAWAQAPESPTLRKIREAGLISIGYRESSIPFSYLDSHQRPVGYSMDICDHVVDAVKARLRQPDIERRLVPVNSATRLAMVANGSIDMECGVTTHTVERERQVAFSVTTFVAASRLASRRDAPVPRVAALRGRSVTSTVGTTSLRHLQKLYTAGLATNIVAARDDPDAFRLLENRRVDAYAMDDVLLHGSIASSGHAEDFVVSEDALSVEPYAIVLPRDDQAFKRLVDEAIVALFRSGEIHRLHRAWFESPIPPSGINLRLPMHPAMQRAIAQPTDSPDPERYR
jgi:glutamate/aspartate transport system substrate-binding protein